MKNAMLALALLALATAGESWAGGRGRGGHFGGHRGLHSPHFVHGAVFFGVPLAAPYFYAPPPPPYYYAPPPVYVEPYPAMPAPQSQEWYYCPNLGAYYPYVKDCPGGWQHVLPQPPLQPPGVG